MHCSLLVYTSLPVLDVPGGGGGGRQQWQTSLHNSNGDGGVTKMSTGAGAGVIAPEGWEARIPKVAAVAQQVEAARWRDTNWLQQQPQNTTINLNATQRIID